MRWNVKSFSPVAEFKHMFPTNQVSCLLVLPQHKYWIWHQRYNDVTGLKHVVKVFNFSFLLFPSVVKFGMNFCQGLTLLSPSCALPCCFLSVCQNNEGKRNTAFGLEQGQSAQCPHEYSVLHMVPRIRICIFLKALIRMLDFKRSSCGCCHRTSWV